MNTQSDSIDQLAKALAAAQSSLSVAKKDGVNPHFKSSYATLQSIWDSAREVLAPNGLSVVQTFAETDGTRMSIVTTLLHVSGQWVRGTLTIIPQRADPQGIGSAVTYGRRYAISALLGIVADEDDDGNAASTPPKPAYSAPAGARLLASDPAVKAPQITVPRDPSSPASNWRAAEIHFGKSKGIALGDLEMNNRASLDWWINNWEPKPFKGAIDDASQALRSALDQARAELTGAKPAPAALVDNEDVPF
jgi:hypothetical protein